RSQATSVEWAEAGIRVNGEYYYDNQLQALDREPDWVSETNIADSNDNGRVVTEDGALLNRSSDIVAYLGLGFVQDAAFSADGTRVLTAEDDGGGDKISGWIREWSADSGQFIGYFGGGNPGFNQLEASPDGRWYATATVDYYGAGGRG